LAWIWDDSPSFNRFRGEEWMPEPCRGCPRRAIDFGGCRCQAFQLTGDAAATDPVCYLSPHHGLVERVVAATNNNNNGADEAPATGLVYRHVDGVGLRKTQVARSETFGRQAGV
jgi:pyrroloquinoline quinone biosynthesis protein E